MVVMSRRSRPPRHVMVADLQVPITTDGTRSRAARIRSCGASAQLARGRRRRRGAARRRASASPRRCASRLPIEVVAVADDALAGGGPTALRGRVAAAGARVIVTVATRCSPPSARCRQPSGVVAIARRPPRDARATCFARRSRRWCWCSTGVQDAGNVGASCAPPRLRRDGHRRAPKARRIRSAGRRCAAAMGSTFRLPIATRQPLDATVATRARRRASRSSPTVPRGGTPLPRCDLRRPTARSCSAAKAPGCSTTRSRRRRRTAHHSDARAGRIAERRDRRGADPLRGRAPAADAEPRRR